MVEELILAGADIIKVGIGPGDHSVTLRAQFCFYTEHNQSPQTDQLILKKNAPQGYRNTPSPFYTVITSCKNPIYKTMFINKFLAYSYLMGEVSPIR